LSFNFALNQIKPTSNFTLLNKDITTRLENLAKNSSNPVVAGLKNILNRDTCTPIIGINDKVCFPLLANTTNLTPNNLTNGTSGLPSMSVSNNIYDALGASACIFAGALLYGGVGELIAWSQCF